MRTAALLAAGLLAVAIQDAGAQQPGVSTASPPPVGLARRFSVTPTIGSMQWDWASALATRSPNSSGVFTNRKYTPTIGLSADYAVVPALSLGFYFDASRPTTRGDFFPAALFKFGQDVELNTVSQRVTSLIYGVQASLMHDFGRLSPYVGAGVGAVTINMDPQQNNGNASFSKSQSQFGGGLKYHVGRGAVAIDARDFMFYSWNRDLLYPVNPDYQNTSFPSANATPPAKKSTINNFRLALGFSFTPQRSSISGEGEDDTTTPQE